MPVAGAGHGVAAEHDFQFGAVSDGGGVFVESDVDRSGLPVDVVDLARSDSTQILAPAQCDTDRSDQLEVVGVECEGRLDVAADEGSEAGEAALVAHFDGLMREISESPHGRELFDASVELVGEIVSAARAELIALIAAAWEQAEERGEVNCRAFDATSQQLAALLVASVDGLKQAGAPHLSVRAGVALQLRVLEAATGAAG